MKPLSELRAVAEAATQAKWVADDWNVQGRRANGLTVQIADCDAVVDARHIATFDPPTCIELCDEIEMLRKMCADLQHHLGKVIDIHQALPVGEGD